MKMEKKKLLVQDFILANENWEEILPGPPYCIKVTRDTVLGKNLLMLKYNQIESDYMNPLVRECRGLILDSDTFEVVSFPFMKFGNFGEPYCPEIDWSSASITSKIDGSLIKIVRFGKDLLISTNGTIDAFKAPVAEQAGCPFKSFGDIAWKVVRKKVEWDITKPIDIFEEGYTSMFELVSQWTRVVVPFHDCDMYFLGVRDNTTFQERLPYGHRLSYLFPTPKRYPMKSIDECISAAKDLPWDDEGYVVVDKDFNRVKVKSPSYVAVHHLKGEGGVMSYKRAVELVRTNEIDEVVSYFPEFKPALEDCKAKFTALVESAERSWEEYLKMEESLPTRKDKALWITKNFKIPAVAFCLIDGKIASVSDFFMNSPAEKVLQILGYREKKTEW